MSQKTRILLIIAGLPAGGAERQMVLLAKTLDRSVYEVGFLIFNAAEKVHFREVFDVSTWFRALELSPSRDGILLAPRLIAGLHRAVVDFKPDIVHSSLNVANHATRITALLRRWTIPIVTSVRVDFRKGYRSHERFAERLLWRRSNHIICNAETTRLQLMEDLSVPADRVSTIQNGIDEIFISEHSPTPPDWWPPGRVALTVGRFKPQKNYLGLVAAIGRLATSGTLRDWHFVFLGEGPLEPDIRAAVERAGLQNRISLVAPQPDLAALYGAADLFVLPSHFEGLSNALLEAAACGCPAAVTHGANDAHIIDDSRGWVLAEPLDAYLEKALTAPNGDRELKGQRAAAYVAETFSAETMANRITAIYEDLDHSETSQTSKLRAGS